MDARAKLLFIFRSNIVRGLHIQGTVPSGPDDFLWGMNHISPGRFDVSSINAPREGRRRGIRLLTWPFETIFARATRIGLPFEIYLLFSKEIKRADEIVCTNDQIALGILFWRLFGFLKKPRIHCVVMSLPERVKFFGNKEWARKAVSILLGKADTILTLSDLVHSDIRDLFGVLPSRISTVGFGVDTEYWAPLPTLKSAPGSYVISIGNDMNRDYETLMQAVPSNIETIIVTSKKIAATRENVTVISDWISNDDVRELYQNARITVIPSVAADREFSGLSTSLQSMANGTPLLVANLPALVDLFSASSIAVFYEAEDSQDLRKKILELWEDGEKRELQAARALGFVRENFDSSMTARRIESILG